MVLSSRQCIGVTLLTRLIIRRVFHSSSRWGKTCDPLRVLFCGSDDFSIASLRALNEERINGSPAGIKSIDVVCRPGKHTGRDLKTVTYPPIYEEAQELGLELHEIDTFTRWQPPLGINLVVAVSFGLLVPPRILGSAKYGGLNVHPSMLPDLRGAAPLQHTLLQRRNWTGVSIQTLHPTKFDHGMILAQSPFPGVPVAEKISTMALRDTLAPLGAQLLVQTLRRMLFVSPIQPISLSGVQLDEITSGKGIAPAPKIKPEDRQLDWGIEPSNEDILLRSHVLGRLWDISTYSKATGTADNKRVTYENWTEHKIEGDVLEIPIQKGLAALVPIDVAGNIVPSRPVQLVKEDLNIGECDRVTARKIYTSEFTVEGGVKGAGGKDLLRYMMRHRTDLPVRNKKVR